MAQYINNIQINVNDEAVKEAIMEQTLRSIANPTYDPDPEMTRYMQDRYGLDTRHDGLPRSSGECGFIPFNVVAGKSYNIDKQSNNDNESI